MVPFAMAAVICLAGAVAALLVVPRPLESALYAAVGAVAGGLCAGFAVGAADPGLPDHDYTAAGSVAIVLAFLALIVLSGSPAGGYLAALLGGSGAAMVGLDSGRNRA